MSLRIAGQKTQGLKTALVTVGLIPALLSPNLKWLTRLTARVENQGPHPVENVVLFTCGKPVSLGLLASSTPQFQIRLICGEDRPEVQAGSLATNCQTYVEGDLYHIQAWFTSPTTAECINSRMPPFRP